ncbi:MAG TPA: hypothetical protein VGJ12_15020, partial [Gemmatimonadaceae bacterium]
MTAHAVSLSAPLSRRDDLFFGTIGIIMAVLVFLGFAPTFFLMAHYAGPPLSTLRIVHGTLFTSWIVLYNVQVLLIASDRVSTHRALGVVGAMMAAAMVPLGVAMAITAVREGHAPPGIPPLAFLAISLFDMAVFAPLVAYGIYLRRRRDFHKRLMLLATVSLVAAAVARMSRMVPIPPAIVATGPLFYFGVIDVLIVVLAAYDLITRRRVHPVTLWGGT